MPHPTRRSFLTGLAGLSAVAVAPALGGCGSSADGGTAGPGAAASDVPVEEGAFPVTMTHKYGETTLTAAPERVVCVGLTEQDALLALGVVPVGVTYWFGDEELRGIYPWARDALGDAEEPELLKDTDGVQVERIAALRPDLIIGQYSGLTEKDYRTLSKLAPVVAQSGEHPDYGMPWDEMTLAIGTAVGRPDAAQRLVDRVEQRITDEHDAHPEFAGQTAAVVTPYEGLFIYGPDDPRSRMLVDLGFDLHPLITGTPDNEFGVSLSAERTADLGDVGAAVWLDLASSAPVEAVWEKTAAAGQGRWFDIGEDDGSYYVAHSFVTPLSIPYLLDTYVPQLAAAADGDPATTPPGAPKG